MAANSMSGIIKVGRYLDVRTLRNFILDYGLTSDDTILVCTYDFDETALDFRNLYQRSIVLPFFLEGVLIKEDQQTGRLSIGEVIVIKNDTDSRKEIQEAADQENYSGEVIYRCGWCGNVVAFDGAELESGERKRRIEILERFGKEVVVKHVNGKCCPPESYT